MAASALPSCLFWIGITLASIASAEPAQAQITLSVFTDPHPTVSGGTIGFAFAGNKFVGSVDRDGTGILYQTDLSGQNVRLFAPSVSIPSGSIFAEHVVASSLGLGGFPKRDLYVAGGTTIIHITNDGSNSDPFSAGFPSPVRGMTFDSVGTFDFNLLVTTYGGEVYRVNHRGKAHLLAFVSDDIEGMDVAPLGGGFGMFDGQLVVVGATSGLLHAISASGKITTLNQSDPIPAPERLSFVPMNLGASSLEGLYSANWPPNVLKADAEQFAGFKGDAIVITEVADHRISRVHWNGSAFEITVIGSFPSQAEDGFFLTPAMLNPGGSCPPRGDTGGESVNEWCWPNCKKSPAGLPKADAPDLD